MDHVQPAALPPGSRIAEYDIVRVLGAGGFGITYLAFDHQLDGPVALKEYFPADVASRTDGSGVAARATTNQDLFAWGLDRFIQEARAIHRLRHPNVVRAYRYLEANSTAYIVLEYVEGEPLKAILDRRGRLSADEWRPWMDALLDGLAHVHAHGYLHRDIKPANIVVRSDNGEPVLIDFGSARLQHGDRTLTQVLTAGYAPIEQYTSDAAQGPQGDIYAMAAVSYRVLTGRTVPSAPDRVLNDDHKALVEGSTDADLQWLTAIDRGLALRPDDRPQTVEEWRAELDTDDATSSAAIQPQPEADAKTATARPHNRALGETEKSVTTTNRSAPAEALRVHEFDGSTGEMETSVRVSRDDDGFIIVTYVGSSNEHDRCKWPVVLLSAGDHSVAAWGDTVDDAIRNYNHSRVFKIKCTDEVASYSTNTPATSTADLYLPIPRDLCDWLYMHGSASLFTLEFDHDSEGHWAKELRVRPSLGIFESVGLFASHWPGLLTRGHRYWLTEVAPLFRTVCV